MQLKLSIAEFEIAAADRTTAFEINDVSAILCLTIRTSMSLASREQAQL
jgi:hypothetical protein